MNIIELAKEAGIPEVRMEISNKQLERFAALVAAHYFNDGWIKGNKGLMEAVREEREACAKVCAMMEWRGRSDEAIWKGDAADECAAAIRARGEK